MKSWGCQTELLRSIAEVVTLAWQNFELNWEETNIKSNFLEIACKFETSSSVMLTTLHVTFARFKKTLAIIVRIRQTPEISLSRSTRQWCLENEVPGSAEARLHTSKVNKESRIKVSSECYIGVADRNPCTDLSIGHIISLTQGLQSGRNAATKRILALLRCMRCCMRQCQQELTLVFKTF